MLSSLCPEMTAILSVSCFPEPAGFLEPSGHVRQRRRYDPARVDARLPAEAARFVPSRRDLEAGLSHVRSATRQRLLFLRRSSSSFASRSKTTISSISCSTRRD